MEDRYLYRGKRIDNGEWIIGQRCTDGRLTWIVYDSDFYPSPVAGGVALLSDHYYEVNPITIGHCTGLKDKDGRLVFEGDIVNYSSYANYNYQGIVCVGEYEQDGSGAEYGASKCYGVYIKRIKWIPHDWQDPEDEECCLPDYLCTESLLEVDDVEIIDNCWDNPELLHEEETA